MSRTLRVFAVVFLLVGGAGAAATEYVKSTMPAATPPNPYASQSPPDCDPPEKNPVPCGAYDMTCEETADYHRRSDAMIPGRAHVVVCAKAVTTSKQPD
ncbi:hypothetical protein AB0P36_18545 [Streptomyces flavidovirens]|uniref:hypothetical protein n=1 Tax=Streptomyces flavidovirens TaxID=67298 RepID=UPI0034355F43